MEIVGKAVIFDDTPILGLVGLHDRQLTVMEELCSMYRLFPVVLVALAFSLDHVLWYAQSNPSIDVPPMSSLISLGIVLESSSLSSSCRNTPSCCLISSASALGPMKLRQKSSAYLTYLSRLKLGSRGSTEGTCWACFVHNLAALWLPFFRWR